MIIKIIWNLVYYSSGARVELIKISPSKEKSIFQLIGLINITLTALAFGTFSFIIYSYAEEMRYGNRAVWAIVSATILASLAFHMNRLFISSIKKDDTSLILFLENIPKLILMFFNAVVIGIAFKYIIFKTDPGPTDGNFLEKYYTVMENAINNPIARRIEIFIDIFYLLLTTSPILIRLLSSKGMYDYILAEVENREFYASIQLEDDKTSFNEAMENDSEKITATTNKITLPSNLNKDELKSKIAKDLTHEVLTILINQMPNNSEYYNELILLSARLEMISKKKRSGIISSEKHLQERNAINYYLLELADVIIPEI